MDSVAAVSCTLDSRIDAVDEAEASVCRLARSLGFEEADRYFIGLAVREILINAIRHGNRFDATKKVGLRASQVDGGIEIEVTDEGEGFRVENVRDPFLPENQERTSGRGVKIALSVMDEFSVDNHTPRGTHVRMLKHLPARRQGASDPA